MTYRRSEFRECETCERRILDRHTQCGYCARRCGRCGGDVSSEAAERARTGGTQLLCPPCAERVERLRRNARRWTITKVAAVVLIVVGWIGAVVLFGGDDESEWCQMARDIAEPGYTDQ